MHEWNEEENSRITTNNSRQHYLQSIEERIDWDIKRLQSIINQLENKRIKYTADDIITTFQKQANEQSLFNFMQGVIAQLQQIGKQRTSETYRCTLKSLMQFREGKDVLLEDIDSDLMLMYEAYLHNRGLTKNSTSFYMRILRAVYNRAVEKDLTAEIAKMVGLSIPLTLYVARHSWASIAKSKNIPVSVISEGMGHDSEMTTQIYLASLDNSVVDRANAQILKDL